MTCHTECDGSPCPIHNPSDHPLRDAPMQIRWGGLIERTCPHGIGHPDPDSLDWLRRHGHDAPGIHGCDGCCHTPKEDQ